MMNPNQLLMPAAPHLHLLVTTPGDACDFARSLERMSGRQNVVRTLRGSKARNSARLFDEFAAALQFPHYFGENWDALDECLADFEWLPGDAYVLFFIDSHRLLEQERDDILGSLLDVLENAAREWSRPRTQEPARPAKPFHAVFQCSEREKAGFCERVDNVRRSLPELK